MLPFEIGKTLDDYEEVPADEMLVGYFFGTWSKDKTPYDYITDKATGLRSGDMRQDKPSGVSKVSFRDGIKTHHIIPPIEVWDRGRWLFNLDKKIQDSITVVDASEQYDAWVVSGEGTPGGFLLRVYILPDEVSHYVNPDHPIFWDEKIQEKGNDRKPLTGGAPPWLPGAGPYDYEQRTSVQPPKPPPAPTLPVGIHFRCPGCGHWFPTETKLAGHSSHCCPGSSNWDDQEGADWIIECECCPTFDATAQCKEGFPRRTKEKASEELSGATSGETSGSKLPETNGSQSAAKETGGSLVTSAQDAP